MQLGRLYTGHEISRFYFLISRSSRAQFPRAATQHVDGTGRRAIFPVDNRLAHSLALSPAARAPAGALPSLARKQRMHARSRVTIPTVDDFHATRLPSLNKPFVGFWQPRKAGYRKIMHTQNTQHHCVSTIPIHCNVQFTPPARHDKTVCPVCVVSVVPVRVNEL